ncbi:ABC transporter substrate-binding protein [Amnibacterium sp. CER49]|uniref:ABC transporter substrate-binding protein n=1 Tax=Amnibacterium sp. CER49 TaxID=3039161 RepID=UPI00244BA2DA|nr:ABC transporter substrate-binding protein [Amnibacterium sp. CER49]MDH2444587.1 ABC transporter substrate-binding protein [Amnibacterium sp. CER49]
MIKHILAPLAGAALAATLVFGAGVPASAAPSSPAAATAAPSATLTSVPSPIPVTGTTVDGSVLNATFQPTKFVNQNGRLALAGNVVGTLTSPTGTVSAVNMAATTLVTSALASGSCKVLDLTLGPLHLDLLGLVVDLSQVHLTITAQSGPGNLLGNLLCTVANLLNNGGGGGLATLLNKLLGL